MPEHGYAKKQKTTTLILIEARRKQASTLTTAKDKPNKVGKGAAWFQSSSKRRSQRLHHRCLHRIALQSDKVSACNQKRHCSPTKCLHATKRDLHKTCHDQMNGLLYNTCDRGTESGILQSCTWKGCAKTTWAITLMLRPVWSPWTFKNTMTSDCNGQTNQEHG